MSSNIIPDEIAVAGIKKEVMRALPFWKIFLELREEYGRKPTVVSCEVSIKIRISCSYFKGVDVLWVESKVILVNWRRSLKKNSLKEIPHQYVEMCLTFGSMHFVHQNAHIIGNDKSYNLQSVVLLQRPEQMQCVAGNMVHFTLLVYGMLQLSLHKNFLDEPQIIIPPSTSKVLILGMGGNSMECGLRYIIGPEAHIYLSEIEPSVVNICKSNGLLGGNTNTHVLIQSAEYALNKCPVNCNFIFMDVFEPINGKMINSMPLIHKAFDKLEPDGILVINEHSIPTIEYLSPLIQLFGDNNVQFINIHGWNESIITAIKPGGYVDSLGNRCSKRLAYEVLFQFDKLFPGWMPNKSCFQRSNVIQAKNTTPKLRARQWTS